MYGKSLEGNLTTKLDGTEATIENTAIKRKAEVEMEVNEREIEPYKMEDLST